MDERLRKALDELEEAESEMAEQDTDDRVYAAACQVAYAWRAIKNPKARDLGPTQRGICFTLNEDGSTSMRPVDR